MTHDLRLIEDYLPIAEISAEASREKSVRKGHISTLHLWWARRPLVACRAAVYGALVPADRWVKADTLNVKNPPTDDPAKIDAWRRSTVRGLNRKQAREFVASLCRYPTDSKPDEKRAIERSIDQARGHILEAHAERLAAELSRAKTTNKPPAWVAEFNWSGETVTNKDIEAGRAPRPRVLDMFAGGGAIPLESLRLGCEAYALDLNPVAHIIELCTLVYPQKYGAPAPTALGMTGPKNAKGETTWGGLAEEVRYWGDWVLRKVKDEVGDLYPLIPDPEYKPADNRKHANKKKTPPAQEVSKTKLFADDDEEGLAVVDVPPGFLLPIAYLWTRTVRCKMPTCGASVPLVKQTWLSKKAGRLAALKMTANRATKSVRFEVVRASTEADLGFDPSEGSDNGSAACPFCGTVADADYVQTEGTAGRRGQQMTAVICVRPGRSGRVYVSTSSLSEADVSRSERALSRLLAQEADGEVARPIESINPLRPSPNARGLSGVTRHGFDSFGDLFAAPQLLTLLTFSKWISGAAGQLTDCGTSAERATAVLAYLACALDREAEGMSTFCRWNATAEKMQGTFGRHALAMVWDYCEISPFGGSVGDWMSIIDLQTNGIDGATNSGSRPAFVQRGSALELPFRPEQFDAIITDPPYYDNVPYADVSDFFYVWLKRTIGPRFPEHFAASLTPKRNEATALASRHSGNMTLATVEYEQMMQGAFAQAHRTLVPGGALVVVYAHKTTLGWSTLVESLRGAGFTVTEAWPVDTEMKSRMVAMDSAALASSIFLVARKRDTNAGIGNYEDDVQPELESIVRERVGTLWDMGITGADLVISCVGAGLRAFTRFEQVEYASGEPVPAQKFLAEVEAVVLDTLMDRLLAGTRRIIGENGDANSDQSGGNAMGAIDTVSRFYVLWRYLYKAAEMDAGEAIIFANGLHVELDGQGGLSDGKEAALEKKKGKYRLRDFTERGKAESIGLSGENGAAAPIIDVLHRTLYLMEHRPAALREFLDQARPNRERLRLLAAALAGPGLSGKSEEDAARLVATTPAEQSALGKLLANWKNLVPESVFDAGASGLFGKGAAR